jgi:hypothetical protein
MVGPVCGLLLVCPPSTTAVAHQLHRAPVSCGPAALAGILAWAGASLVCTNGEEYGCSCLHVFPLSSCGLPPAVSVFRLGDV